MVPRVGQGKGATARWAVRAGGVREHVLQGF
jgi:hypothetical protein